MTREESIKIYQTYSRKLFNISFRIVGNTALAEEIMQDTLLKFLSTADALASGSPLATGRTQLRRSEDGCSRSEDGLGRSQVADRGAGVRRSEDGCGRSEDGLGRGQGRRESAWLTKTCVRASIDALRKMRREREFLDEYAGEGIEDCGEENGDGEFVDVDGGSLTVERVKTAMDTLPKQYRLILTLVLIEGLDYEEISEMTGEREGALRTRFSRARKMLAERLRKG
ncbi:MAG: RNA polymerase sigma factor [Bacteroidales bacterium]|nr:RNA polymerase sigma factor [Bacteroidales bacterium]